MTPHYWPLAIDELSARDAVLRKLTSDYAGFTLGSRGDAFATLARAIVGQQISVKAAQTVWERLIAEIRVMTPDAVLATTEKKLRACGLSGQKTSYIRDLAQHFWSGALRTESWQDADDEALISELTKVRGIGRWTAEMFLIFYMARPDVLPIDDIGLQRAMSLHYNSGRPISRLKMRRVARNWAPWRSVATWYLWRSLDPIPVVY